MYDVRLDAVRPRAQHVDFSLAPPRSLNEACSADGDVLFLEPSRSLVERIAPAVDFGLATGRPMALEVEPVPEGRILDLAPQPEAILPNHGTLVSMRQPRERRRVKRRDVVQVDDTILCEIERELAAIETN